MKPLAAVMLAGVLTIGPAGSLRAHTVPGGDAIVVKGEVNIPFVPRSGGTVFLHLTITTPEFRAPKRKPLNLSIVLDRSGSMADEGKLGYAKAALRSLVNQLSKDDILSIVIYDDIVEVLHPASRVRNKREILRRVENVTARGSTNLGGGMIEGFAQVKRYADRRTTNRVILLSDGLANQGITDPHRLNGVAREHRGQSISLTTMGVGLDYNENLMVGLAEHGGGNYYFIESPHSIAHILNREFDALSAILAQNARLRLNLGPKAHFKDVIGTPWQKDGDEYVISMGDLYSDNLRELTLELDVAEGSGEVILAHGVLQYDSDKPSLRTRPEFRTTVAYTADETVVEKNRDMTVQAKADVAVSTRSVERAMQALDEGRSDEAARELDAAQHYLKASPAASAAGAGEFIQEQRSRLEEFGKMLNDSTDDLRRAKKAIQYKNYQLQKNQ